MNFKKLLASVLAFVMLVAPVAAFASNAETDEPIDEMWGAPILAHGASLTAAQLDEVKDILGITGTNFDYVAVTGADMVFFLGSGNQNASMLSTALIERRPAGTGVLVEIVTPDNITRITENQYTNAMITAGVTDAHVRIVSPVVVTGEAALTGIYKAFYERGYELDQDRMGVAQKELEITSSIANELANNPDFDTEDLDATILEIKNNLAELYDAAGNIANDEDIQRIVREALANNDLDHLISSEQMARISSFANSFQLTDAIRSTDFRNQLENLADRIGLDVGSIFNTSRDQAAGFFTRIWNWITSFFN